MPPKKAVSTTDTVEPEGVPYSLNLASKIVVVGTGVVSNSERDTFKASQKANAPSLEDQIRGRPKWHSIAAAAHSGSSSNQSAATHQPLPPPPQPPPQQPPLKFQHEPAPPAQQPQRQPGAGTSDVEMQDSDISERARKQPARKLPGFRDCWICMVSNKRGAMPLMLSDEEVAEFCPVARIGRCSCGAELCNAPCTRRGPCPSHASWEMTRYNYCDCAGPAKWRVYAEVAAGIGCQCSCCLHLHKFLDQCYEGWELHSPRGFGFGDDEDAREERAWVRDALAAVGNPVCHLRDLVMQCDACEGDCGMKLWGVGICGGGP